MADEPQWDAGEQPLSAEEVAASTFPTAFRGFDPVEVRAFLARVADELRAGAAREAELREALRSATSADVAGETQAEVDAAREEAARLSASLREADARLADQEDRARLREADATEQSERVLAAARDAAARLVAEARDEGARTLRDAREEAGRLGSEADRLLAEAKEAAAVAGIEERRDAERDAAVTRVKAREEADAIVEAAKERGREMVGEAQAARDRMRKDLARRRRGADAQLEHLKEARDRVMEHLRLARRAVDDVTSRFEPVESGWATMPVAAPRPPGAKPQIDAAQAGATDEAESRARHEPAAVGRDAPAPSPPTSEPPASTPTPPSPPAETVGEPALPEAASPADDGRPATREERKSSALRILRRGRSQSDQPASPSADEPVEGVRLIGPPPRITPSETPVPSPQSGSQPDPEPEVEAGMEAEVEAPVAGSAPEPEPEAEPDVVRMRQVAEAVTEPREVDDGVPAPSGWSEIPDRAEREEPDGREESEEGEDGEEREPVRPGETLDELFARLRAGRDEPAGEAPGTATGDEHERPVSDEDERALQRRDLAVEETEATMLRRLKRAMQDEQNAALDALRTRRGAPSVDALVGGLDTQQQRFRRLAAPILGVAAAAGAATGEAAPSEPPGVDDLVDAFAREVSGALRDRLERALSQAEAEELDAAVIAERLNAVYRDFKAQRAERIGGHFVIAAHARGAFEAMAEGSVHRWVVDDGGPCPDCDDNALAGAVSKGDPYPTGQVHPPAHVGCRCLLVAAAEGSRSG